MQVDLTKLEECCFPAIHDIGSRGLNMFNVFYLNVPDVRRLVSLEFACRVDENLRKLTYSMLGDHVKRMEIDGKALLWIAKELEDKIEAVMDDYCDGVLVGTLDGGDEEDDIINGIDRYTMLLIGGFCAGVRYYFAGAYAVSLCKVNNAESYVIRLDEIGEDFDRANPRKMAQSNSWEGDCKLDAGMTFLWLGKRVRFENVVHIEIKKEGLVV